MLRSFDRRVILPVGRTTAGATVILRLQQSIFFREYQRAFEATIGLPLALRAAGSFQQPLQGSTRVNPFCALMTQANKTCAACLQLQQRVEAAATRAPKTLECYAGMSETAVPVRIGDQVLGYLQTGQVFLRVPSRKQFNAFVRAIPGGVAAVGAGELASVYFATPVVPREQYEWIVRLLAIFADHLAVVSNQMLMKEGSAELPAVTKGRAFIAEHQSEELSLADVARAVSMSAYYFCRVFKKATGVGFTEYLARTRIESVKIFLLNAHARVSDAAYAAGFQSLSQFNRVFRRIAGEAPSRYRDRLHALNGKSARSSLGHERDRTSRWMHGRVTPHSPGRQFGSPCPTEK